MKLPDFLLQILNGAPVMLISSQQTPIFLFIHNLPTRAVLEWQCFHWWRGMIDGGSSYVILLWKCFSLWHSDHMPCSWAGSCWYNCYISRESLQTEVEVTTSLQESSQTGVEATTFSQESSRTGVVATTFSKESWQTEVETTTFSQESSQIGVEATTFSQESSQTGVEASEVVSTASLLIRASPTATSAVSCGFSLVFLGWLGPGSESENAFCLSWRKR